MSALTTRLAEWGRRVWHLINRGRFEESLRREMESHRAMMSEPARFGNTLRLREEARDVWGWGWIDDVARDVRFAVRTLVRAPALAAVAICSLALATGATTAIFSVVNAVLLRPLPFADPDRLVSLFGRNWREDRGGATRDPVTGPVGSQEINEYERQSASFEGFAGYASTIRHLDGPSGTVRLTAVMADIGLFDVLGVQPIAGRTFRSDDPSEVAVISAHLWRDRFDADPSLAGRTIALDGRTVTIIGVMPDWFQFPFRSRGGSLGSETDALTDLWVPFDNTAQGSSGTTRRGRLAVVARLKPGVSAASAQSELDVIARRVEEQYRSNPRTPLVRVEVRLVPLSDVVLGQVRRSLWLLFAAVGLVLAAACANVANLLLARMTVRTREVVTRAALGASPRRLMRQFLAESVSIGLAGGAAGAAVASWGTGFLASLAAARVPRAHEIALDWQAFAFLLVLCLATALLFGMAPALTASRVDVQDVARESGGHATMGGRFNRMRDALVVVEVALAFVLALGAAIVVREILRLQAEPTGMVTENVVSLHMTPRITPQEYYAIEARVQQLPGVVGAGCIQQVPLQNWGWFADFSIRGRPGDPAVRPTSELRFVTPGYFRTLGIPVLQGRALTGADAENAPRVILVNEALARRYFPAGDAVGSELDRGFIVGVVGDVRGAHLDRPADPAVFYPIAQNFAIVPESGMALMVRTNGPPERAIASIRAAVREVNPRVAIFNVKTMEQVLAESLWDLSLYLRLIGLFAILALALAGIGIYGVISYNVTSRIREFAVRLALGSEPGQVARLVLARGARLVAAGLVIGLATAAAAIPVLRSLSTHTSADPWTYAAIAVLMLGIAGLACLVPALRVSAVNPAAALRHD